MRLPAVLDLAAIQAAYADGMSPVALLAAVAARADAADPAVFIARASADELAAAVAALLERAPQPGSLPLWGVPVAVKDNIDAAGFDTTAACPAFAYRPLRDAVAVARLRAAGAIVVGKTNLDQFATGLNGTRSPFGAPRSVFGPDFVSGGSSSGSAVAVAAGIVPLALGTDTAGSGRVPAAFNNIVGAKPSPGRVPTTGVVPACRSLDVVTVFAATVGDALAARRIMEGFDAEDPFARRFRDEPLPERPRVGVLAAPDRAFEGNSTYAELYAVAIARAERLGATIVEIDFAPFAAAAALLYDGPWVAERLAALEPFLATNADAIDPVVRAILEGARGRTAVDAFRGRYALEALRRRAEATWREADLLLLPTAPDIVTVAAMRDDPIRLNARLGHYTNFANLLDLAAVAVPAGFTAAGLPFGVTLFAQQDRDEALGPFAAAMHDAAGCGFGRARDAALPRFAAPASAPERIDLVVVGAHLTGMPLNRELVAAEAVLVRRCRTAPGYRFYALPGTVPPKPGLVRTPGFAGPGIEVEVWSLAPAAFGRFVAAIPPPLGIGKIELDDGALVSGFLAEPAALDGAREITEFGGWRAFMAAKAA